MTAQIKVKPIHVRQCKMCMSGARKFFERHKISWRDFVHGGVDVELIEATGDAMALEVARVARGQH